ncbi:hypothetical protein KR76_00141 [Pimelobacter simplex]|uniref:Uncharacterized protein n=1 Tax=Nocardioides simplex TaxID=2045 RepID=A0A0C5XMI5_NOCSI|nr:hypothetical protein KR76_00141 [Pimelobacter simplex]
MVLAAVVILFALSWWLNGRPAARRGAGIEQGRRRANGEAESWRASHSSGGPIP